jgi:hypothetical protein
MPDFGVRLMSHELTETSAGANPPRFFINDYSVMALNSGFHDDQLLTDDRGYQEMAHPHWLAPKHYHLQNSKLLPSLLVSVRQTLA